MGFKPRMEPSLFAALQKQSAEAAMVGGDGPDTLFINGIECLSNFGWHLFEEPHPYLAVYEDELKRQMWLGNPMGKPVIFLFHNNRDVGGSPTNSPFHWFRSLAEYHGDSNYLEIVTAKYVAGSYISGGGMAKMLDGKMVTKDGEIVWEDEEARQRRILGSKYVKWDPVERSWD
jgi:hypothetical protein